MKTMRSLATLVTTLFIASAGPALAQEFLNPVATQAPTFLQNGAFNSGGATGNVNNSSNLVTAPGALNGGLLNGRQLNLPQGGLSPQGVPVGMVGLLAPNSVNNTPFDSGSFSYGFPTGVQQPPPGASINQYGYYAGQQLPVCSTASVDLNIVDNSYLAQYNVPNNPYAFNPTLSIQNPNGTWRTVNFQQTAAEAQTFIQSSLANDPLY